MGGRGGGNNYVKIILALITVLGASGGVGYVGYSKLQADADWHGKNIEALKTQHASDMQACESKFNSLKVTLDTIAQHGASTETKVDMLVQMVRDHTASTR